jgi:membrane-bound lytic murein transglycosylase C
MEPENVYEYLFKNLPYKETRNYIKKVRLRMAKYKTGK